MEEISGPRELDRHDKLRIDSWDYDHRSHGFFLHQGPVLGQLRSWREEPQGTELGLGISQPN